MSRRRRTGLRRDGGASAVEYGAILILVAALAAVFAVVALPERVKTNTAAAICQLFSGNDARDCPDEQPPVAADDPPGENDPTGDDPAGDDPALPDPDPQGQPPAAAPANPALDPNDPDVKTYNDAKQEADAANQALDDLGDESDKVKQEILDLLKDLVGITDIEDCLSKGDIVACISALAGLVPWGKVFKILKKIPGAVKLAKRLKELWDKVSDAKARKKKADDALDAAKKKLDDKGVCKLPSSFLPGTRILLADGTSKPIEHIRIGDLVWATDPAHGVSGPRPVTRLITSHGTKHLVALSTGFLGRFSPALTATANHPFWASGARDWRNAAELAPGASLRTPSGRTVLAGARPHTAVARVHNLTVADLHTYYALAGGTPVLVHNAGGCWRDRFDALPDGRQAGSVKIVKDAKELRSLFDNLAEGAERLPARGPKIPEVYKLEDGTVVQWRTASQSGGETIDIFPPGGKPLKVHIDGGN
ncbi:polymorphic toxin-type HINT domain-containing protein [Actinocorallia aurantiaca]|uniref:Intein n=1 Tax=Actinocorallia aurantiaca TaxID=46204 RepID=A0ABN3U6G3_9ACTN